MFRLLQKIVRYRYTIIGSNRNFIKIGIISCFGLVARVDHKCASQNYHLCNEARGRRISDEFETFHRSRARDEQSSLAACVIL